MISTITFSCGFLAGKYFEQQQCPERVNHCQGIRELNREQTRQLEEQRRQMEDIRKDINSLKEPAESTPDNNEDTKE